MGYQIAEVAASLGANVILISGPVNLKASENINLVNVVSAQQMHQKCLEYYKKADVIIMSAAVADYTPCNISDTKIKKNDDELNLQMKKTIDILKDIGSKKNKSQVLCGFALETNNEADNAKEKLKRKNLDLIVLNSMKEKGAGFGHDTNKITIFDKNNNSYQSELLSKRKIAEIIINYIIGNF